MGARYTLTSSARCWEFKVKTLATPVRRVLLLGIANRAEGTNCRLVYLTVFVLVVLSIVEFSGCSGARLTGVTATLKLTANPTDLSFSNVTVGRTSSQNVTLTNLGDSSVTISRVTVSGAGFSAGGLTSTRYPGPEFKARRMQQSHRRSLVCMRGFKLHIRPQFWHLLWWVPQEKE